MSAFFSGKPDLNEKIKAFSQHLEQVEREIVGEQYEHQDMNRIVDAFVNISQEYEESG